METIETPIGKARYFEPWDSLELLRRWFEMHSSEVLGIDCETNALDPWHPDFVLRSVQVATPDEGILIPIELFTGADRDCVRDLIAGHKTFVAHFAVNDIGFLVRGLPGSVRIGDDHPHIVDSQTVLAVYDPRTVTTQSPKDRIPPQVPRKKGLKETSARLVNNCLDLSEKKKSALFREIAPVGFRTGQKCQQWGFANVHLNHPVFIEYAALDPMMTVRLYNGMRDALKARNQWQRTTDEFIIQWMLDQATVAGLEVDGPYAEWLTEKYNAEIEKIGKGLAYYSIPPSGMGPNIAAAFESLGLEPRKRTPPTEANPAGGVSWDRFTLESFAAPELNDPSPDETVTQEQANLAWALLKVRRAGKYRKVFVDPMVRTYHHHDGAMHCQMRAIGTVTSRMTAQGTATSGPLHQLPKRATTYIRAAVRARSGHVFVSADFARGEPTTMAALSGDPVFTADVTGGDINSELAALVYGSAFSKEDAKDSNTPSYQMRQKAKFAFLAWCYGCAARKLAGLLGIPVDQGQSIIDRWRNRYPVLAKWQDRLNSMRAITLDSGWIVPLWDRTFVDDYGNIKDRGKPSRLGPNAATQGTQADLLRVAMRRLHTWGWTWAFRFALHDEILLEVPEHMAAQARDVLEQAMTIEYRGVTLHCEATIEGKTWLPQPKEFTDLSVEFSEDGVPTDAFDFRSEAA